MILSEQITKVLRDRGGPAMTSREIYEAGDFEALQSVLVTLNAMWKAGQVQRYEAAPPYRYGLPADVMAKIHETDGSHPANVQQKPPVKPGLAEFNKAGGAPLPRAVKPAKTKGRDTSPETAAPDPVKSKATEEGRAAAPDMDAAAAGRRAAYVAVLDDLYQKRNDIEATIKLVEALAPADA